MPPDLPRFSLRLHQGLTPQASRALASSAEAHGFHTLWFAENPFGRAILRMSQASPSGVPAPPSRADRVAGPVRRDRAYGLSRRRGCCAVPRRFFVGLLAARTRVSQASPSGVVNQTNEATHVLDERMVDMVRG
jgi:hypothetical protein